MEEIEIQYLPEVEEYFGYIESAFKYIDNITDFIERALIVFLPKIYLQIS
ncbi:hypothetical protein [Chryseobacterium polytrichastri]|nr:hypothetical protein [Chryseobacterium polytrichastri]